MVHFQWQPCKQKGEFCLLHWKSHIYINIYIHYLSKSMQTKWTKCNYFMGMPHNSITGQKSLQPWMVHPLCVRVRFFVFGHASPPTLRNPKHTTDGLYENRWSIPSGSPVGRKVSSAYCTERYLYIYIYVYCILHITCRSPCPCKPHVTILWECPITV